LPQTTGRIIPPTSRVSYTGKLENAVKILASYKSCHALHMQFEDDVLIPVYADFPEQGRWDATLYQREYQKIDSLYEKVIQSLLWLIEQELNPSQ
jgi:hypothetical protein